MQIKSSLILTVLLLALCLSINAQTLFQRTFGTTESESGTAVCQTNDNGYLILSSASNLTDNFTYLIKTDLLGNKIWSKKINFRVDYVRSFVQTQDGIYLIYGDFSYNLNAIPIIKLDSDGNIVWQEIFKWVSQYSFRFREVKEAIDGTGYIATGDDSDGFMIAKFNLSGEYVWSYEMTLADGQFLNDGRALDVIQSDVDSCLYLLGKYRYGSTNEGIMLSKFTKNGINIWTKSISVNGAYNAWPLSGLSIKEMYNGNMMVSFVESGGEVLDLVEVDTSGTPVSSAMRYSLPDFTEVWMDWDFAEPTINKSLHLTAILYPGGSQTVAGLADILLIKTDTVGSILWTRQIGGRSYESVSNIITNNEGVAVVVGSTKSFSAGRDDTYLIKIDSNTTSSCNSNSFALPTVQFSSAASVNFYCPNTAAFAVIQPSTYTVVNMSDTSYDACGCVPPRADFFTDYPNPSGGIQDNSTWVTDWFWDYGNGLTDSSQSPNLNYSGEGIYNVCLKVSNACGVDSVCHLLNYIQLTVSTPEVNYDRIINVYPNPATTEITVSGYSPAYLRLCNVVGQTVAESTSNKLSVADLSQGLYVLQVFDAKGQQVKTEKVIVTK